MPTIVPAPFAALSLFLAISGRCRSDDAALAALARFDPRKERVVELRFFGGLSVQETAEVLKISPQSVMRDWKLARAWLLTEMQS